MELQDTIISKAHRYRRPQPPPFFTVGAAVGRGKIVEYLGVIHRPEQQKWRHKYRLQCECGRHYDRWQESLKQSISRSENPGCGCSPAQRQQPAEPLAVPCFHAWGYDPRERVAA